MRLSTFLERSFKVLCCSTAAFMVGYWIYRYDKNEDVTLIEYVSLDKIVDMVYPEISICLFDPFLKNDLINETQELDFSERYTNYLSGEAFDKTFENLDYEKLTPNLIDYIEKVSIGWKPGTAYSGVCSGAMTCPYLTFKNNYNGFYDFVFMKCYGIGIKKGYGSDILTGIKVIFKQSFANVLNQHPKFKVSINYPNQFTRPIGGARAIWMNSTRQTEVFSITSVEILNRRNTKKKPCSSDWHIHDEKVRNEHLKNLECSAPYHKKLINVSICNTKEKMKKARYDGWISEQKYSEVPCQEMPYVDYRHDQLGSKGSCILWINYPTKAKFVKQLKDVDAHTLVGNIGGYIGLFLGYAIIQLPELIRYIIKFAKVQIYENGIISPRKLTDRNGMVRLKTLRKEANNKLIEVKEMKDFKAIEVSEMLLQHEHQITSILKRIDVLNQNLSHNKRN